MGLYREARCDDGVGCDVTSIMLKASVRPPYAPWFSVVGVCTTRRSDGGRRFEKTRRRGMK